MYAGDSPMKRGTIVFLALVMLCTPILSTHQAAIASAPEPQQTAKQNRVDLKALRELLTKGLKVTRPVEEAFIDHVVILVGENKLPVSLVYAAFRWARRRRPDYPFPYFQSAVKALAKQNKIDI
jgi:hypothetical protein